MLSLLGKQTKESMLHVTESLKNQLKKIRTGRAHASLLEDLTISYYGNQSHLSHIASISCPDSRTLIISPWDQNILKNIEEAIVKSSLGIAPQSDGKIIRLKVPELTEDRRKEIIRTFKKDIEKSKVDLRQIRREMNEQIRKQLKEKSINEDESKEAEGEVQKLTDQYVKIVDEISLQKEKELNQV